MKKIRFTPLFFRRIHKWVGLILGVPLLVFFVARIQANLRARDAHLADLRQRLAEEDHIVRMGLLASGAAHELGTPLATLSVILGDWSRMPAIRGDDDLALDVAEMQGQVERCKAIVSGILMSSGEARAEGTLRTTVNTFLDGLVAEWRSARAPARLDYANRVQPDLPIVSDAALKQIIVNVLDNAVEASPERVAVTAERAGGDLVLRIRDHGPGFEPAMLDGLGKPYRSTKGRPGGGLGLFLVVNVLRKLGGGLRAENWSARNGDGGGACVTLTLPLAALSAAGIDGGPDGGR